MTKSSDSRESELLTCLDAGFRHFSQFFSEMMDSRESIIFSSFRQFRAKLTPEEVSVGCLETPDGSLFLLRLRAREGDEGDGGRTAAGDRRGSREPRRNRRPEARRIARSPEKSSCRLVGRKSIQHTGASQMLLCTVLFLCPHLNRDFSPRGTSLAGRFSLRDGRPGCRPGEKAGCAQKRD